MMGVARRHYFFFRWDAARLAAVLVAAIGAALGAWARAQNPTSATDPFWGSVTAQPVIGEVLKLSLDDAVARGFRNNLGLKEAENEEKSLHGEKNEAMQEF